MKELSQLVRATELFIHYFAALKVSNNGPLEKERHEAPKYNFLNKILRRKEAVQLLVTWYSCSTIYSSKIGHKIKNCGVFFYTNYFQNAIFSLAVLEELGIKEEEYFRGN